MSDESMGDASFWGRFDEICDRFESAWKDSLGGKCERPRIERFLGEPDGPDAQRLFDDLLNLDVKYRKEVGEQPKRSDYETRFSDQMESLIEKFGFEPGDVLGDYELLGGGVDGKGPLGGGGMGEVWKARHQIAGNLVALKVIQSKLLADKSSADREYVLERFHTEVRAAAALEHDHIVRLYYVGQNKGRVFYTMQLIEGDSLESLIRGHEPTESLLQPDVSTSVRESPVEASKRPVTGKRRPTEPVVPARETAKYVEQAARAVQFAHNRGVLHRDLKPGNVMIDRENDRAYVTDFGLAKLLEGEREASIQEGPFHERRYRTQAGLGTVGYMAPEQAQDAKEATVHSDVYSLGATLFALLVGQPPRRPAESGQTLPQLLDDGVSIGNQSAISHPSRRMRLITWFKSWLIGTNRRFHIHRDMEAICLKCLQQEPEQRYQSAQALADDLRRYLHGEPITARPGGTAERVWRWCRRKPALAVTGVVAALALLGAIVVSIAFAVTKSRDATRIQQQLAESYLDRGLALSEQDDNARGLLWMARSLDVLPAGATDLDRVIRLNLAAWSGHLFSLRAFLKIPDGSPLAVAFSPNGSLIVTGSGGGTAQLWDADTDKPLGEPLRHGDEVRAVAFSPDGTRVVTGSRGGTVRLWDADTGRPIGEPMRHQDSITTVRFSPDGKTVLTASRDATARLWDVATGNLMVTLQHPEQVRDAVFSPDGSLVLTGTRDAWLWDVAKREHVGTLPGHRALVEAVAFSADGTYILTGSWDETAQLWDATELTPCGPRLQHRATVRAVAFSPVRRDGTVVLTGSDDGTVRLWDAKTGALIGPPLQHQGVVCSACFSPDGSYILTGSLDNNNAARLWEVATPEPLYIAQHKNQQIYAAAFSPDGSRIVTGSADRTSQLWDVHTRKPIGNPLRHQDEVKGVAFSPDGRTVLTGSYDRTARLWDVQAGRPIGQPMRHESGVEAVAFNPDGKSVLTATSDGTARLWEVSTGRPIGQPLRHQGAVLGVAFGPDSKAIVTGCDDGTAQFWESPSGRHKGESLQHQDMVHAVAFSPDGSRILTGCHDGTARLWEVATGKPIGHPLQHRGAVLAVAFSPDGSLLLTGSSDNTLRVWDKATLKPIGPPLEHQGWVFAVAFGPDGSRILTASGDTAARLWKALAAVEGETERIKLWMEVLTGMELKESGAIHGLDVQEWQFRRRQLEELGRPSRRP